MNESIKDVENLLKEILERLEDLKNKYKKEEVIIEKGKQDKLLMIEYEEEINNYEENINTLNLQKIGQKIRKEKIEGVEKYVIKALLTVPIVASIVAFTLLFINFKIALIMYGVTIVSTVSLLKACMHIGKKISDIKENINDLDLEIKSEKEQIDFYKDKVKGLKKSLNGDMIEKHNVTKVWIEYFESFIWDLLERDCLEESSYVEKLRNEFYPEIYMPNSLAKETKEKTLYLKRD